MVEIRPIGAVASRFDRPDRLDGESGPSGQEPELARREAGRPQVVLGLTALLVAQDRSLVVDAQVRVEGVVRLEEADLEVCRERARPRPCRRVRPTERCPRGRRRRPVPPTCPPPHPASRRRPGTTRSRRRTRSAKGSARASWRRNVAGSPCAPGRGRRQVDEPLRDVDADDLDAPLRERQGVPARAAPDVEDAHAGLEMQRVDEERHLLGGSLRERVTQIRVAEMVGQLLEPMC